ncbi:ABC transporter ATP-binding protein [Lacrimispora sp. NSJ-141]|uniref:ABC transporter ATP-binding protein n=1 Tax=Lientehia hominis TaxID=2897778 RepID=A0AAP2RKE9_9FIRM|nr:ABC transporter ATP-binding protein [Lientehia hominis]MCD2493657.1 ABC transporter ATP-binding protein [Lientehia hominis]
MLKTDGVTIRFGGLVAVNKVSIHVRKGQITGLIGPNGAGKTTFFNCISGVYKPSEGHVIFDGKNVEGLRPHKINEIGMARTYQVINLFRKMTVQENIMVGMHTRLKSNFWSDMLHLPNQRKEEKFVREETEKWMEFVGLQDMANQQAGSLSYGKQRLLEIVRGLASDPKLILLDEPVAGMNSKEKEEFDALLRRILDLDVTILMIEHDMKLVMGVCDYVYCLEHGTLLAEGVPEVVQNHPDVIAAYLGGDE